MEETRPNLTIRFHKRPARAPPSGSNEPIQKAETPIVEQPRAESMIRVKSRAGAPSSGNYEPIQGFEISVMGQRPKFTIRIMRSARALPSGEQFRPKLTISLKRRAGGLPSGGNEHVHKARRIDACSSSDNKNNDQPRNYASPLPTETWMQILESVDHSDHYARPSYVNCFVSAIIQDRANEADLVPELPAFEKRAWKAARAYYAIDKNSRQAAHACFATGVLLQGCTSPLNQIPIKRVHGCRKPHAARTSIPPPFYAATAMAKMRPRILRDGKMEPTYMPLELFDISFFHEASLYDRDLKSPVSLQVRLGFMGELVHQHVRRLTMSELTLLRTVRRVDLLAAAPYEPLMGQAGVWAQAIANQIEMAWRYLGVKDGVVRVWR